MPAATYHDEAFFADEMERIHLPAWQMVCHTSDIPGTGDYETFEGLGKRAFVIRGDDGTVRAFHNVCPHRAHAVVSGAGNCPGPIRCPYHSWAFDFEGNLKAIAAQKTFPPFDNGKFGLTALECEVFMGFVYIRFRPGGASVAERYGPHADELASYRFDEMVPITPPHAETMAADWKNVWDNYLEDYHFPTGHPGLFALMNMEFEREPDEATRTVRLSHTLRDKPKGWAAELYARHLPDLEHLPENRRRRWTYIYLYPTVSFDIYPDMIDYFHVVPTGPAMHPALPGLWPARRRPALAGDPQTQSEDQLSGRTRRHGPGRLGAAGPGIRQLRNRRAERQGGRGQSASRLGARRYARREVARINGLDRYACSDTRLRTHLNTN